MIKYSFNLIMEYIIYLFATICILGILSLFIRGIYNLNSSQAQYNKFISYKKGKAIKFADFLVTYQGENDLKPGNEYPSHLTFTYHDFIVQNGKQKKTISWTSGNGTNLPQEFKFNGKRYALMLKDSIGLMDEAGEADIVDDKLLISQDT